MAEYETITLVSPELDDWERFVREEDNVTDIFGSRVWGQALEAASRS